MKRNAGYVHWPGGTIPNDGVDIHVGNAGLRLVSSRGFGLRPNSSFKLDGDEAMRKRPMSGLLDALKQTGSIEFLGEAGFFPSS